MRTTKNIILPAIFLVVVGALAGCATQQVVYEKVGATQADRERDHSECLRAAVRNDDRGRFLVFYDMDREAYVSCLEARGYVAKRG